MKFIAWLDELSNKDVELAGGKGASLGEMWNAGLPVPPAFVVTAEAYRYFIKETGLMDKIKELLKGLDINDTDALNETSKKIRSLIEEAEMPEDLKLAIIEAYNKLCEICGEEEVTVAVRSSATAEDLPSVSKDEYALVKVDGIIKLMKMDAIYDNYLKDKEIEIPAMKDGKVVWAKIKEMYKHTGYGRILKIKTRSGREIDVSPNHSIILLDEKELKPYVVPYASDKEAIIGRKIPIAIGIKAENNLDEINLKDIFKDWIIDNNKIRKSKNSKGLPVKIKLTPEIMYFFGVFLAEGTVDDRGRAVIISNKSSKIKSEIKKAVEQLDLEYKEKDDGIYIYSVDLLELMKKLFISHYHKKGKGKTCKTKIIPDFVYNCSEEKIGYLLGGLFDGDGYIKNTVSLTTASEMLALGVVNLLSMLGIHAYISKKMNKYYVISIPMAYVKLFAEKVKLTEKKEKLMTLINEYDNKKHYDFVEAFNTELNVKTPMKKVIRAFCPICESKLNKTSKYKGKERYICKNCRKTFYKDEVVFREVEEEDVRDELGRFKKGIITHNAGKFSKKIGKNRLIKKAERYGIDLKLINGDVIWDEVIDVEERYYEGDVYDFVIPELENFSCGFGIITHNSASFAGQQDTYLNIKGAENVVKYVQKCFSSLFTPRAIFYREQQGFDHFKVALAAVVQKLVNAEKAGVMFTVNPISENYDELVIEAAWGLGEGVVSGSVSPDTYIVNKKTLEIIDKHIARKETMFIKDEKGETKVVEVPEDMKEKQVLSDDEIKELAKIGLNIEKHYGKPMDVEWAYEKGKFYMLQARPITTLKKGKKEKKAKEEDIEAKILLKGIGASPGIATGVVKIIHDVSEIDKVKEGDILVTEMTTPDMVPAMKKAAAIVTDEGGLTCIEGDAKVLTDRGFLKMKEVYELVKNGEKLKVLGLNAQTLKTEWKEIIDAQKREAKRYEIGVYRKNKNTKDTIKITPDHKFPVFVNGELSKVQLKDIIDNNLSVLSIDYIPMIEEKYECLADVMYLGGAVLSDGHIIRRNGKPIRVRFTQKDTEEKRDFIEKVKEDVKLIGGSFIEIGNRNNVIEYQTSRKMPSEILGFIEDNINTIPLYATEDEIADLIAGFVDGDGCLSDKRRIEIYQNSSHIKKIEGLIVGLYRLGIIPRLRYKRSSTVAIYFNNNLETILQRTRRIKLDKLKEFKKPVEDKKLIDLSQILPELRNFDYNGYLYKTYKEKLFIGINKLEKYLNNIEKDGIEKIKQKIKLLKESDIYSIRIKKVGEDNGDVYNITVKAEDEFNHNYIVWTKHYTPIVVFNCHAAIVSRELGTPCVVGTKKATKVLKDGMIVTVDGEKGIVYEGEIKKVEEKEKKQEVVVQQAPIITATEVKVNVSMPEVAERAAATGADGVGLLRAEHMILGLGKHPRKILEEEGEEALIEALMEGIRKVADAFYPRPVTYRTLDAPTDEFRGLEGGENEPIEHNPMLGWRGIRRDLDEVDILKCELKAIKRLREEGYKNIEIMIPLVTHPDEVRRVKEIMREVGLEPCKDIPFGIMVETPAAALIIEDFIKEGINFVSLGTNDLTQYTIAIDRNNELVSKYYKEDHPAVLKLVEHVIKTCKKHGIKTSICGQAGSRPHIVEKLVEWGIDSVSANIDAVETIRRVVARTEQKVILNFIRKSHISEE